MPQRVSAILLAAGRSQRMGRSKPLLPLGDRPVICHCLDGLLDAEIDEVIVVTAQNRAEIEFAVGALPVRLVDNPDPASDMAGSVRVGMQAVSAAATAVLVCPVDHPLVSAITLHALIEEHRLDPAAILIPFFKERRGHPTLFPRAVIEELHGAATLRDVVRRDPARVRLIEVADEGAVIDMDTPDDYARVQAEYWRRRTGSLPTLQDTAAL